MMPDTVFQAMADADMLRTVEVFLAREAELLDDWRLQEWFGLFEKGAHYVIAPLCGAQLGVPQSLPLVNDDYDRLRERINHLVNEQAWAERPHSRTRRLTTNVRLYASENSLQVRANFVVYQFRNGESWEFVDTSLYHLTPRGQDYAIAHRFVQLDHQTMEAQRRISIIV